MKTAKALTIVKQPEAQTVTEGETAVLTVKADGEGLSYQWQYSKNGEYWFDSGMSGSDTDTLKVAAEVKRNGQQYRCVVKDARGNEAVSEAAALTVTKRESTLAITAQPTSQIGAVGENVVFHVEAEGNGLSYQWQYSTGGIYWFDSGMEGAKTASLTVPVLEKRNGQQYRCVIKDSTGSEVVSEAAVLSTRAAAAELAIIQQPEDQEKAVGETAVFSVKAEGEGLSYQWQYSNSGGKYWYVSGMNGSKTDTLNVEALAKRAGQKYRCVITDANGNKITSNEVVLNIK